MRAAVQERYGVDHIKVSTIDRPEPGPQQVRVRVDVAAMNAADWHLASDEMKIVRLAEGFRRPKALVKGTDACGTVDAVGGQVSDFKPGDVVFGVMKGAFAEYALAEVDTLALAPEGVDGAALASLPIAGVTALQAVERGNVRGASVVVNGASGGVGHYAVQLARAFGADSVDGVCSAKNMVMVKELQADQIINYELDDFASHRYDVIIDCVGSRSVGDMHRCLNPKGRWLLVGAGKDRPGPFGPLPKFAGAMVRFVFSDRSFVPLSVKETRESLETLANLHARGDLHTRFDTEYSLDDIVDAYRYLGSRRAKGKILVRP